MPCSACCNPPPLRNKVLGVFQEKRVISDETARFEELLVRQRDFFVEEELKEKYKRLISFVQQTEATMSLGEAGELTLCSRHSCMHILRIHKHDCGNQSVLFVSTSASITSA